jgi:NADPH:quinone reductase-like Zn-dependent oxidoreductase
MSQQSAIPKSMRAIAIDGGVGPARALKLASMKTPMPNAGEVLIRVAAAGVNNPDIMQREGRYPLPPGTPETLGLEISGTVAVVGAGVRRFRATLCRRRLPGTAVARHLFVPFRKAGRAILHASLAPSVADSVCV